MHVSRNGSFLVTIKGRLYNDGRNTSHPVRNIVMRSKRSLIIVGRFLYYTLFPVTVMIIGQFIPFSHTRGDPLAIFHDVLFWKFVVGPLLVFGLLIAVVDLSNTIKKGRPGPLIDPAVSRFIVKIARKRGT